MGTPSAACAAMPHSAATANEMATRSFLIVMGSSVRGETYAVGYRLELAATTPPRNEEEEREIKQRAGLRDVRVGRRRLLGPEETENEENQHERDQQTEMPRRPVAHRLDRRLVDP